MRTTSAINCAPRLLPWRNPKNCHSRTIAAASSTQAILRINSIPAPDFIPSSRNLIEIGNAMPGLTKKECAPYREPSQKTGGARQRLPEPGPGCRVLGRLPRLGRCAFDPARRSPYDDQVGMHPSAPCRASPMAASLSPTVSRLLPPRSMVGQLTLDQHIGVRIPGGQPRTQI